MFPYTLFRCDEMVAVPVQVLVCVCWFSVNCCVVVTVGPNLLCFSILEYFSMNQDKVSNLFDTKI